MAALWWSYTLHNLLNVDYWSHFLFHILINSKSDTNQWIDEVIRFLFLHNFAFESICLIQHVGVSWADKCSSVKRTCLGPVEHCAFLWSHVSPGVYWTLCVQSQRGHGSHRGWQKQPERGCHKWVPTLSAFSVAASHGSNLTVSWLQRASQQPRCCLTLVPSTGPNKRRTSMAHLDRTWASWCQMGSFSSGLRVKTWPRSISSNARSDQHKKCPRNTTPQNQKYIISPLLIVIFIYHSRSFWCELTSAVDICVLPIKMELTNTCFWYLKRQKMQKTWKKQQQCELRPRWEQFHVGIILCPYGM